MRARISLSSRILILAAVNLLLLCGLVLVVARYEFGVGIRSFLFAPAHDSAVRVAREVAFSLQQTPANSQTALMARYAAEYGADFFLFRNDGTQLAGRPAALPDEVREALQGAPPPDGAQQGSRRPPPPPDRLDDRPPPPPPGRGPGRARQDEPRIFELRAGGLYWVGARIPIPSDEPPPIRGSLLIAAKSFYGTPLFFNFRPWLAVLGGAIAIFVICWLPFIRGLTRTISRITAATELIAEGRFDHQ
ncbi:MAG: hypothetical protein KGN84_22905, partial [Acidobacteriota bacterium]|nr:hypothetical protein [Acidobacteriota bacterium]